MISPQDFIHPEDEVARQNMEGIPGFAAAVKAFAFRVALSWNKSVSDRIGFEIAY